MSNKQRRLLCLIAWRKEVVFVYILYWDVACDEDRGQWERGGMRRETAMANGLCVMNVYDK